MFFIYHFWPCSMYIFSFLNTKYKNGLTKKKKKKMNKKKKKKKKHIYLRVNNFCTIKLNFIIRFSPFYLFLK